MPAYFLSDVHLRYDRPDRGRRLAAVVDRLGSDEPLTIVGDLLDFWSVARQRSVDPMVCPGLRSLADYRSRGGSLTILPGNHDAWSGRFYRDVLGATWVADSLETTVFGLRLHLVHGHRVRAGSVLKDAMESRLFLRFFASLPNLPASLLEKQLERSNEVHRRSADARLLKAFREYADQLRGAADIVAMGHVHVTYDDEPASPRMIVLGNWHHSGSFLKIDDSGAQLMLGRDEVSF